ncbi:M1 family metallopeptidase [Seonamhaeicola maritimus]|uniref:M1 family metallopeptidase n=1 Tax=Seonamhaeicola maritimus TaxID=2591822 RepID=A0A5C7GF84_9FLAO|nr:M1 family metallopeptidase [Seonamhaeicola maritimus]TXG35644.1 M1 family metallopeptidase [Seonamhaeicola maritimus]
MKIKHSIIFTLLSLSIYGQSSLYMPIEFQNAYKNKTRALNGNPGENYWQNSSSYTISAEIEPETWKIRGSEKITYTNNSPDSLTSIIIKTYPNHYKKGMPRANRVPLETLSDGMLITDLTIDNSSVSMDNNPNVKIQSTYIEIQLSNPILPHSSVILNLNWTTQMPSIYVNRIGAYDDNSAFIGYWYPQIARYDDIDGWDRIEYLGIQEFNTDFASFDVKIKVPSGYNVWATGDLLNPKEVLTEEELKRYNKAKKSNEEVTIISGTNSPLKIDGEEIWHYKALNVKDFAFGVSNTFKWISNTVTINGKKVISSVVYDTKYNTPAKRLLEVQEKGLIYASNISPGITYPYNRFTTFIGVPEFDGQEFPMLANNGMGYREIDNTHVTQHELAHTYFPFYAGINEVKYSWMEESWAIYFTIKFIQSYYKNKEEENAELNRNLKAYNKSAGYMWEVPLITPSYLFAYKPSHIQLSYRKPAFMYFTLENMLGEEVFEKCLKTYINRWAGKHPTPYDFMFTFNTVSDQNLNWFWNAWVFKTGYGDLEITKVDFNNSKVIVSNIGGLPLPIKLQLTYKNGSKQHIERTANVWSQSNDLVFIDVDDIKNLTSVKLITNMYPDSDLNNNNLEIKL